MAGSAPVEEAPKLGKAATIFGTLFVVLILSAFSFSTMMSYEDTVAEINSHHDDDHGDDHADDHADDHGDDHADDHAEDDHADDHGDDADHE